MKVLLINCPVRERAPPYSLPLGLAYLIPFLRKANHKVEVLDINGYQYSREEVKEHIKKLDCDIICTGGLLTQYKYLKFLTAALKKYHPNVPIVIGGNIANEIPHLLFKHTSSDILMLGEAEITICQLADALENRAPFKNIDGLAYKENDNVIYTAPRKIIENIDSIPFPEWDLFPVETYIQNYQKVANNYRAMPMIITRGCPFVCKFCYHSFMNEKARFRTPDNIISEMKYLIDKYKINSVMFYDDLFLLNRKIVEELCDMLIQQKIDLKWNCLTRLEMLDENLILKMKKAGCIFISYGMESGSQTILDNMRKGINIQNAKETYKRIRKLGLINFGTFMLGYPGENMKTIRETVDYCKELGLPAAFFFATPYPGTALYEEWKHKIPDEDKYVESLGDVYDFKLNMTEFSDEELIKIRDDIEHELKLYCYVRPWIVARLVKDYYLQWGLKTTVTASFKTLYSFMPFTKVMSSNLLRRKPQHSKIQDQKDSIEANQTKLQYAEKAAATDA